MRTGGPTGPPKQFAALCGTMFSALAFFFFLVYKHEYKVRGKRARGCTADGAAEGTAGPLCPPSNPATLDL